MLRFLLVGEPAIELLACEILVVWERVLREDMLESWSILGLDVNYTESLHVTLDDLTDVVLMIGESVRCVVRLKKQPRGGLVEAGCGSWKSDPLACT